MSLHLRLLVPALSLTLPLAAGDQEPVPKAKSDPAKVQAGLKALAAGKGDWNKFNLTYDDLHGFHGGLKLTIKGTGEVKQKVDRVPAGELRAAVGKEDLRKLVESLLTQHAWEQKVADRKPNADESKARLTIEYDGHTITIWEWYNDLPANGRIGKIRDQMTTAAWKAPPKK